MQTEVMVFRRLLNLSKPLARFELANLSLSCLRVRGERSTAELQGHIFILFAATVLVS